MLGHINPLRCARGLLPSQTPTNFGATGLFNNDNSRLLKVWQITGNPATANAGLIAVTLTRLANHNVGIISPVVTGEGSPPGQIDWDDLAAVPSSDYGLQEAAGVFPGIVASAPIAVLRPGWSLLIVRPTAATAFADGFFWEWCWPQDLYTPDPFARNNLP
jgi:hypothetical protein